jgi:hypothetical protein
MPMLVNPPSPHLRPPTHLLSDLQGSSERTKPPSSSRVR